MKIVKKNQKSYKLPLIIVGLVIVLGSLAAGLFVYKKSLSDADQANKQSDPYQRKVDLEKPTSDQIKAGQTTKEQSLSNDTAAQNPSANDPSFIITAKNVNTSASVLQIRTLLSGVVSQGTCVLTLTKDGSVISRNVNVQAGPANSTCQGFDIPLSELSNGTWNIKITLTAQDINKVVEEKVEISGV